MAVAEAGENAAPRDVRGESFTARPRLIVKKEKPQEAGTIAARVFEESSQAHRLSAIRRWRMTGWGGCLKIRIETDAARTEYETSAATGSQKQKRAGSVEAAQEKSGMTAPDFPEETAAQ